MGKELVFTTLDGKEVGRVPLYLSDFSERAAAIMSKYGNTVKSEIVESSQYSNPDEGMTIGSGPSFSW